MMMMMMMIIHRFIMRAVSQLNLRHQLLLLSPKADTHFTVPPVIEDWVDLEVGWLVIHGLLAHLSQY